MDRRDFFKRAGLGLGGLFVAKGMLASQLTDGTAASQTLQYVVDYLKERGVEEAAIAPDQLIKSIRKKVSEGRGATHWLAVGEGRERYPDIWKELTQLEEKGIQEIEVPVPFSQNVQGRYIGLLAYEGWQAGLQRDAENVLPRYLRASSAEVKLDSKNQNR